MDFREKLVYQTYINNSFNFFDHPCKAVRDFQNKNKNILWYNNLNVNHEGGSRLLVEEKTLRVKKIRVWASDVFWNFSSQPDTTIKSPKGLDIKASEDFRYPELPPFCVVVYQVDGIAFPIKASTSLEAEFIELDDIKNVYVCINDKKGEYAKNSGAFDLNIEILD